MFAPVATNQALPKSKAVNFTMRIEQTAGVNPVYAQAGWHHGRGKPSHAHLKIDAMRTVRVNNEETASIFSLSAYLGVSEPVVDKLAHFHRFLARSAAGSHRGGRHHVPVEMTLVCKGSQSHVSAAANAARNRPARGDPFLAQLEAGKYCARVVSGERGVYGDGARVRQHARQLFARGSFGGRYEAVGICEYLRRHSFSSTRAQFYSGELGCMHLCCFAARRPSS